MPHTACGTRSLMSSVVPAETAADQPCPGDLEPMPPALRWLGLDIKRFTPIGDDHAEAEFVARSKLNGRAHRLHEASRFDRVAGRWLYVGGDMKGPPQGG